MSTRSEARLKNFKKGIDGDEARHKREEVTIELRKNKREEMVAKRRQAPNGGSENAGGLAANSLLSLAGSTSTSASSSDAALSPANARELLCMMPTYLQQMQMQHDANAQLDAVAGFRKLLSIEHQPPIDEVIASGAVPYFIHFLQQTTMPQVCMVR